MDMARVERPVIWDGMFNLWIGEVIVFTHSDKQFLDGMAGRINSALSGMVERSVVDGLVEALRTLKKDSALGMGEKAIKDAMVTGHGFMKDGACVSPDDVFKSVEDHELEQLRYLEKQIRLWKQNGGGNLSGVVRNDINAALKTLDGLRQSLPPGEGKGKS